MLLTLIVPWLNDILPGMLHVTFTKLRVKLLIAEVSLSSPVRNRTPLESQRMPKSPQETLHSMNDSSDRQLACL